MAFSNYLNLKNFFGSVPFISTNIFQGHIKSGTMGALAPTILKIELLAPAILGQSITISIRNSKVLNRPLRWDIEVKCSEKTCIKQARKKHLSSLVQKYSSKILELKFFFFMTFSTKIATVSRTWRKYFVTRPVCYDCPY